MPFWAPFAGVGWIALIVLASVLYRRVAGKPIVTTLPADAVFTERRASGYFASRCLMVAVTRQALTVTPFFPFTLMFLPEIYGFEHDIPLSSITAVETYDRWLLSNVVVTHGENRRKLRLKVEQPLALAAAIRSSSPRTL